MPIHITRTVAVLLALVASVAAAGIAPAPAEVATEAETQLKPDAAPQPAPEVIPDRGQLLYENHCLSCHESQVHIRERRDARTLDDVRSATARWADNLGLEWGSGEIGVVVQYLNRRYYRY